MKKEHKNSEYFIGLISGTSMDGIDAVLINNINNIINVKATLSKSYPKKLREILLSIRDNPHKIDIDQLGQLDTWIGENFRDSAISLIKKSGIDRSQILAIGSHGQTIRHQPKIKKPFSLQLGDPNIIAHGTKITTVSDFRRKDIAAGGEGAPLTPIFHKSLFCDNKNNRVILNIGGISNITILRKDSKELLGFDTGPGNTLLDSWIKENKGDLYDKDGAWAKTGKTNKKLLKSMLSDPFFKILPPKSTGFEYFNSNWINKFLKDKNISPSDVQRTLVDLTAESIAIHIENFSKNTDEIILCGGGPKNITLSNALKERMPSIRFSLTDDYGFNSDYLEAIAFAFLARQTLLKKPGNIKSVTGANEEIILGGIYRA